MAAYTYTKINWENEPSYNTPINETNLNHMDQGIFDLSYVKAEKEDAVFVNSISLDRKAGTSVGQDSVAAGYDTEATGLSSVAIGSNTSAKNGQAFAGGFSSKALGNTSFAFGTNCITRLNSSESLALGDHCIAGSANQMVFGQYNVEDTSGTYAEVVGNGSSGNESNARTLDWQGNETIAGDFTNGNGETLHGIYEALPTDTESGNPTVITDAFGGACKSLKLTFNPIQSGSGTPSPSNPLPISGRSSVDVARSKKNCMPPATAKSGTLNGITYSTSGDGVYTFSGTADANTTIDFPLSKAFTIPSDEGWNMYLGNSVSNNYTRLEFYSGSTLLDYWNFNSANRVVTSFGEISNHSCDKIAIYITSGQTFNATVSPMFLTKTETDTSFVTGDVEAKTIFLGQTVYGGVLDVTTGVLTINYILQNYVWGTGSAASADLGSNTRRTWYLGYAPDLTKPMYCDVAPYLANYTSDTIHFYLGASTAIIFLPTNTASDFSFNIAYALATPTTVQLTAEEVTLLHGDNVLTTDADSIEASYSADIALYIAKKIAEGSNNRSLAKGGASEPEEEPKKEEEIEIKEEEPLTEEVR